MCVSARAMDEAGGLLAADSAGRWAGGMRADTMVAESRYEKRLRRYRSVWDAMVPSHNVLQFCGNMGLFSVGVGWDYGKRKQWETQLLFGYIPKYDSYRPKITMTIKENFVPWRMDVRDGWLFFEPLECGLYLNTVFGHDFWTKQPTKYESGYYPFSTRLRPNVFLGERMKLEIPHQRRFFLKSITAFYELSTNDIYIMRLVHGGSPKFWDLFGLSLGLKFQFF